jgi:hypothetical protein
LEFGFLAAERCVTGELCTREENIDCASPEPHGIKQRQQDLESIQEEVAALLTKHAVSMPFTIDQFAFKLPVQRKKKSLLSACSVTAAVTHRNQRI